MDRKSFKIALHDSLCKALLRISIMVGCAVLPFLSIAQNLIYNPGCELWIDTTNFHVFPDEYNFTFNDGWFTNFTPSTKSSFYDGKTPFASSYITLNQVEIYQGKGVLMVAMGKFVNYTKTNLQGKLTSPLNKDCFYKFSLFLRPTHRDGPPVFTGFDWYVSNQLGFYFSSTRPRDTISPNGFAFDSMNIQPQVALPTDTFFTDTTQFSYFEGTFRAEGGEIYITIANFKPIDSTAFYNLQTGQVSYGYHGNSNNYIATKLFLDDLSLTPVAPPDSVFTSIGDTTVCAGDSLTLFASGQHAQWYAWSTGSTDSTTIITQPGTYWVEAGFNCGFTKVDTIVVSPTPDVPLPTPNQDTSLCPNQSTVLFVPWQNAQNIMWSTGQTDSAIAVSSPGTYWVQAQTQCGHPRNDTMHILPPDPLPAVQLPADTTICQGEMVSFSLPAGPQYFVNGAPASNDLHFDHDDVYEIAMQNDCLQQQFNFRLFVQECDSRVFVPNAFTPNGDGKNECFAVTAHKIEAGSYQIYIADRWGNIVFSSQNPEDCWNGFNAQNQLTQGVYTYRILFRDFNGKFHEKVGTVSVLP